MTPKSSRYSHQSHHSMSSAGSRGLLKSTRLTLLDLIAQYRHSQNRHSAEAPLSANAGFGGADCLPKAAAALPARPARGGAPSARVANDSDPPGFSARASPPRHSMAFPARPQPLHSSSRSLSG